MGSLLPALDAVVAAAAGLVAAVDLVGFAVDDGLVVAGEGTAPAVRFAVFGDGLAGFRDGGIDRAVLIGDPKRLFQHIQHGSPLLSPRFYGADCFFCMFHRKLFVVRWLW